MRLDLAWLPHQNRLKQHGRGHGAGEGQRHHLSHARHARVVGGPHAAESRRIGHGAEHHGPRQCRLQQSGFAGAPGHDVVDLERHPDAEQQRKRDDIGEIELRTEQDGQLQRERAGNKQRDQREQDIGDAISAIIPASTKARVTVLADS